MKKHAFFDSLSGGSHFCDTLIGGPFPPRERTPVFFGSAVSCKSRAGRSEPGVFFVLATLQAMPNLQFKKKPFFCSRKLPSWRRSRRGMLKKRKEESA